MTLASLCVFGWMAALPFCSAHDEAAVGYVEGEYVAVAPIDVARIDAMNVRRGDALKAGDPIAKLEREDAGIALRNAEAALTQAKSDLANIQYGRRPEEIAALEATVKAAQVTADDAARTFQRRQSLMERGYASQADFDGAKTAAEVAAARMRELAANLAVAKLPARADEIAAAEARVEMATRRATRRNGGSISALSSPPAPAMSPTSCAASATSRGRRRRWSRSCRTAPSS